MKQMTLTLLLALLLSLNFTACNSEKSKSLTTNNAQQPVKTPSSFPTIRRNADNVVCLNCRATFKLSRATQKQSHGHSYTECPVCHNNYLKKAK